MTTAILLNLLFGLTATAVPFTIGVLWQAGTTRYWRDQALAARRRPPLQAVTANVDPRDLWGERA